MSVPILEEEQCSTFAEGRIRARRAAGGPRSTLRASEAGGTHEEARGSERWKKGRPGARAGPRQAEDAEPRSALVTRASFQIQRPVWMLADATYACSICTVRSRTVLLRLKWWDPYVYTEALGPVQCQPWSDCMIFWCYFKSQGPCLLGDEIIIVKQYWVTQWEYKYFFLYFIL